MAYMEVSPTLEELQARIATIRARMEKRPWKAAGTLPAYGCVPPVKPALSKPYVFLPNATLIYSEKTMYRNWSKKRTRMRIWENPATLLVICRRTK